MTSDEVLAKLSPEQREEVFRLRIIYGTACVEEQADGTYRVVPPEEMFTQPVEHDP